MEWGRVPMASMAGMVFTMIVAIGLPAALAFVIRRKTNTSLKFILVGGAAFITFAMILEQMMHAVVLTSFGETVTGNLLIYALYGALAAALFEETGRYVAMRFFMKRELNGGSALMYGVGHGGAESVLIAGFGSIGNLVTASMINSGSIVGTMAELEAADAQQTFAELSTLWQLPSYQFWLAGVERLAAVAMQLCMSFMMYRAVKTKRISYLAMAFGLHFLTDFFTVLLGNLLPMPLVEFLLLAAAAAVVWCTGKLWKADEQEED